MYYNARVNRESKYAIPVEEFPGKVYKPYCAGGGFVLSRSLLEKIIPIFDWDHQLRIDDAYYGELVAKLGVKPVHKGHFYMYNYKCQWYGNILVSHPAVKAECMEKLHRKTLKIKKRYK